MKELAVRILNVHIMTIFIKLMVARPEKRLHDFKQLCIKKTE